MTDGPKRLYSEARFWAGANGVFWHAFATIAEALGKSERQVRYDMAVLEQFGLIRHRIRDGRRSNTYEFLWHPWFNEPTKAGRATPRQRGDLSGSTLPLKPAAFYLDLPVVSGNVVPVRCDLIGN